jgi:protein-S-isoprenylcysteine O-methyltransferase Ste14
MWAPLICAGIWFGFILYWVTGSIPKNRIYEIYAGCGIGICLTLLLSFVALAHKGKPEGFVERTTVLIDSGLFGVVRHPLYLGLALWSIGLVLRIQLILPAMLGMVAFGCSWMACKTEDEYNVEKFGEGYQEYMTMVPAWNVLKGLRTRLFRGRGQQ